MKRVVVTGMGVVSSLGNDVDSFWKNIVSGKSGAAPITKFNPESFKTQFACEIKDFNPAQYLDKNEIKRTDLFTQYALYSSAMAIEDAGISVSLFSPFDIGVIWGTGQGGLATFESEVTDYVKHDFQPRFSPFLVPKMIPNIASGMIAMKYGFMGINYCAISACATTNTVIMDAFNYIRLGKAKVIVTGGSEAPIIEASIGGFNSMKAMSVRNDDYLTASRPYDRDRDGFVIGEGGGALILEEYESAKKRGAKIYCEIVGAAMTADAYHMTAPLPDGEGAAHAMKLALEEAQLHPDQVDYINPHATSTPVGDLCEIKAIQSVFGESPQRLSISATKSMTGHLLGGSGAIEAVISIKAINENIIPPTINIENIDPEMPQGIHIVQKEAISKEVNIAMSNSFGFGGHNAIVIFKNI
ncbi:MAG: beta-ketoacyl-ACP synthase II [Prevotella sp.]|jgi:3-oxoacyl-[acyl-carrier-protein] synthase II|nr:beta-ketoacyl-ACP synthase II [Prevotella sp.]